MNALHSHFYNNLVATIKKPDTLFTTPNDLLILDGFTFCKDIVFVIIMGTQCHFDFSLTLLSVYKRIFETSGNLNQKKSFFSDIPITQSFQSWCLLLAHCVREALSPFLYLLIDNSFFSLQIVFSLYSHISDEFQFFLNQKISFEQT